MDTSTEQDQSAALAKAAEAQAATSNRRVVLHVDQTMLTEHGYRPVMVVEGEDGYHQQGNPDKLQEPWYFGHDYLIARRLVNEANERLGLTPKEALDIVLDSMYPARRQR